MMSSWCAKSIYPLVFSSIKWYPNKTPPKWTKHVPKFHEDSDIASHHVVPFMEHASKLKIENDEIFMRLFYFSLEDDANVWFTSLEEGDMSSFACFIQEFHDYWDPIYNRGSDPLAFLYDAGEVDEHSIEDLEEHFVIQFTLMNKHLKTSLKKSMKKALKT